MVSLPASDEARNVTGQTINVSGGHGSGLNDNLRISDYNGTQSATVKLNHCSQMADIVNFVYN